MLAKSSTVIAALALAGQLASASLSGADVQVKERHARMLKRRGTALNGTVSNNPCKREDGSADAVSKAAMYNVKVIGATSNVTVVASTYHKNGNSSGRKPLTQSGTASSDPSTSQWTSSDTREALSSSSSSSPAAESSSWWLWSSESSAPSASSAAPSASIVAAVGAASGSGMSVVTSWTGSDFEDWDYFTWADPTHGAVEYVSLDTAKSSSLVGLESGKFKMSVDTGALLSSGSRKSVRISSPTNWKKGQLVVADFAHMPEGCGTWPAFWSIGAKRAWPAGGEIDIAEGVNNVGGNTYTLHTTQGCHASGSSLASSSFLTDDCQYQPGCSYKDKVDNSFGPGFNAAGGGTYAAYFSDDGIKIWFWSAGNVPSSLAAGSPDMSAFGTPKANFGSDQCNMDTYFDDEQMLIINTTLMGDWAGATYWQNGCTGTLASVLASGSNFNQAYWLINSVKLYQ